MPAQGTTKKGLGVKRQWFEKRHLEGGAGRNFANFRIFDDAPTKFFDAGLEHGAGQIVAVHVEAGEWLEEAAQRKEESVESRKTCGGLGVDEGRAPTIGGNEFHEVVLGLGLDASPKEGAGGASSLSADVVEGCAGALRFEHVGSSEGVGVGDFAVVLFRNLGGRDAKTKEAGINGLEGLLNRGVIEKILVHEGAQLRIRVHERAAGNRAHFLDDGGRTAGFEDRITDRTCGAEEKDFHATKSVHEAAEGNSENGAAARNSVPAAKKRVIAFRASTATT